ncbi:SDR family NAD(P)-dependent oxidoreductase [Thioclava atlantica]|uniref:Short-chain dehydrogenase/reductase family oxidoreductase n=1 Tax=Thioclava atlantica TaxID=1317124 RepID=A0A085TTB4_9RHOB|nr:SDR family NAD(P)-dependent oxidoreductase [Thioclava atlantica]KFE33961.1 short-chain dehydrogenase/reductase family oxidoreductase [Thioclava atlantica]
MSKTILITGCSSGIGYDAAHGLKAAGWTVLATCRKEEDCARLRSEGLTSFPLDMADPASIEAGFDEALSHTGGRLDALYNNAAFACPGAVEDLPAGALREIFETNLFGLHDLTTRAIRVMRQQGENGTGRILQCSSVLGLVGIRWRGAYVATKFALEGLTDVLRLEMRDTGIKVVLIEPGPITSKIRVNSIPHFEKWVNWRGSARRAQYEESLLTRLYEKRGPDRFELPASEVTKTILAALEARNPKARYAITTPTKMMGIARRVLPDRLLDWVLTKG